MWLTGINYCALRATNTVEGTRLFLGVVLMLRRPWSARGVPAAGPPPGGADTMIERRSRVSKSGTR